MKNIVVYVCDVKHIKKDLTNENIVKYGDQLTLKEFEERFNNDSLNQTEVFIHFSKKEKSESELESDLRQKADDWFKKEFNYISLDAFKISFPDGCFDIMSNENQWLIDFWRYDKTYQEKQEYLNEFYQEKMDDNYEEQTFIQTELDDFIDQQDFYDWILNHDDFESYKEDKEQDNYPMWNTLFEFREEPSQEIIDACLKLGLVVIESSENFNTTIGVAGAGFSFYASYWIPLYLSLPWNESERELHKNTKYSHL